MNKPAELKLATVPCWIGGKPVVPAGPHHSRFGEVYNPATGQVTKRVPYCDAGTIDAAVKAAAAASCRRRTVAWGQGCTLLFTMADCCTPTGDVA